MTHKLLLIGMPGVDPSIPSHALGYVAGIVKNSGWICKVADLNIHIYRSVSREDRRHWRIDRPSEVWIDRQEAERLYEKYRDNIESILRESAESHAYDLIAFTVNICSRWVTVKASEYLKRLKPTIPILFGGPDCFRLEYGAKFFEEDGAPDVICWGEAENALEQYLKEFEATGKCQTSVRGFAYKQDAKIFDTGEPDLVDLSNCAITPDWPQFDFSLYSNPGDFPTFGSRGCPNKCKFCSESPNFKPYRTRKAIDVFQEIKETLNCVSRYNPYPTVYFSDSLINGSIGKLDELCDLIIEADLPIRWMANARLSPTMTKPFLAKMARAGCILILWGFESASQKVLNLMSKGYEHSMAERIIAHAHELGISNHLPIIVGFPGEQPSDVLTTLLFVSQYRKYVSFYDPEILAVLPNSRLWHDFRKLGLDSNDITYWSTIDGRNNIDVRIFRRFLLRNAIFNESLSLDAVDDLDDIQALDFNQFPLASEVAAVLYQLWELSGTNKKMAPILTDWGGEPLDESFLSPGQLQYWHPEKVPSDLDLSKWFSRDKNTPNRKVMTLNLLFGAIRDVVDGTGPFESLPGIPDAFQSADSLKNDNWTAVWRNDFKSLKIGKQLIVTPPWLKPEPEGRRIVIIDPAEAWGAGTDDSTQACLAMMEEAVQRFQDTGREFSFLDVGCSSGILAIAAVKLGATEVLAVDFDPSAVESALRHAALNNVESRLQVECVSLERLNKTYDIVAANLDSMTLENNRDNLIRLFRRFLIVSGCLLDQWDHIKNLFLEKGIRLEAEITSYQCGSGVFAKTAWQNFYA